MSKSISDAILKLSTLDSDATIEHLSYSMVIVKLSRNPTTLLLSWFIAYKLDVHYDASTRLLTLTDE